MIASGAGWPAGGHGSGAAKTAGRIDRAGDRVDPVPGGVRPVQPAAPLGARTDRGTPPRAGPGDAEAGRDAPRLPGGRRDAGEPGGRALVPAGPARSPAGPAGSASEARGVAIASAPRPSAPITIGPRVGLRIGAGFGPDAVGPGEPRPVGPDFGDSVGLVRRVDGPPAVDGQGVRGSSELVGGRRALPAEVAAVSDSYRRRGGLPPIGLGRARIFRLTV